MLAPGGERALTVHCLGCCHQAVKTFEGLKLWKDMIFVDVAQHWRLVCSQCGGQALKRQDYSTALQLLKPLAETGDSAAQNNLGVLYRNGQGTRVDHVEALKWFRRSADQRNASAEYNLGLAYAAGFGVAVNKEEASRWFKLSAEQGDLAAQTALGIMYYEGTGVPKNKAGALNG